MIERYRTMVTGPGGRIHRLDWGRRQPDLSDPEGPQGALRVDEHRVRPETLTELEHAFKFNDAVLRHLVVAMTEAVVSPSPMMKEESRSR